jgi:hypothetical protein
MSDITSRPAGKLSPEQREQLQKRLLARKTNASTTPIGVNGTAPIPRSSQPPVLSSGQERLWFLQQLVPDTTAYNIPVAFRLSGPLQETRLVQAYRLATARQEVLRTRIVAEDGSPVPVVSDTYSELRGAGCGR